MSRATAGLVTGALGLLTLLVTPFPVSLAQVVAWCGGALLCGVLWTLAAVSYARARRATYVEPTHGDD